MTENKRFIWNSNELVIDDNVTGNQLEVMDCTEIDILLDLLNSFNNENEQLKQQIKKLQHRHSLLHDVCIEAECDRDMYQNDVLSLEKENGYLKDDNEELKSKLGYEKRQHKHWKKECLENIKEIAQLKREIIQLKGDDME